MLSRDQKMLNFKVTGGDGFPINTKDAIRNTDEKQKILYPKVDLKNQSMKISKGELSAVLNSVDEIKKKITNFSSIVLY